MLEFFQIYLPNVVEKWPEVIRSVYETFYFIFVVGSFSLFFGLILGVIIVVTKKDGILENRIVYFILDKIINFCRAVPFIILLILLVPLTKLIAGTYVGTNGALFPLIVGTVPFFARQIELSLSEMDHGLIEASQAMGSSPCDIIFRVYLKESIPGIIRSTTITLISLIGLIAMVGTVGGGGLGNLALMYGFYSQQLDIMYVSVIVLLLITTFIQVVGDYFVRKTTH